MATDSSNPWEAIATRFMAERSNIGAKTIATWAKTLPAGATVLDLGCGHGLPITEVLTAAGCSVFALDAAPSMVAAFQRRFPAHTVRCEAVESSDFFGRHFDAVVAIGLLFLLPVTTQQSLIPRIATALKPGGRFLFTAPAPAAAWRDLQTGQASVSLGSAAYCQLLEASGLRVLNATFDEGGNHYLDSVLAASRGDLADRQGQ